MMKLDTIRKKKEKKKKKKKKKLFLLPYLFHEMLLLTLTLKSGHSPLGMAKIIISFLECLIAAGYLLWALFFPSECYHSQHLSGGGAGSRVTSNRCTDIMLISF